MIMLNWILFLLVIVTITLSALVYYKSSELKATTHATVYPPIVKLEDAAMFHDAKDAYESIFESGRRVVGVPRKGRLEYIVDHSLTSEVLTNDAAFSFEEGTLASLNMQVLLFLKRRFIPDIDHLVHTNISANVDVAIAEVLPAFETHINKLTDSLSKTGNISVQLADVVHHVMAESMIRLILGPDYISAENIKSVEKLAFEVANLSGIFQNMSYWARNYPRAWRILTWIRVAAYSIPFTYMKSIGWRVFADLSHVKQRKGILFSWANKYRNNNTNRIGFLDRLWILIVGLGLIFASVHQTAVVIVWVVFELAKRPEDLRHIREEIRFECDENGVERLTPAVIRHSERLDSFIREVMRTKGDTLSTVRKTTMDVPLGGYIIPRGSFVIPLATLSHFNDEYHGHDAKQFDGARWVGTDKPASMVSSSYWPFGLGRWACPGRTLAVAEIKAFVLLLLSRADISLVGGDYRVVDPLLATSVAPEGELLLHPLPSSD